MRKGVLADAVQLKDVCEKTLIAEHKTLMVEEFQNLLDLDRRDGELSALREIPQLITQISDVCTLCYRASRTDWRICEANSSNMSRRRDWLRSKRCCRRPARSQTQAKRKFL